MKTKLHKLRLEQRVKQKNVASSAQISIRQYQMIEAGKSEPSVSKAFRIAKALNLPVEELFGDSEHANYSTSEDSDLNETPQSGIEEAKELHEATCNFKVDVETILDIGDNGRLDDPLKREAAKRVRDALNAVLEDAA